MEKRGKTPEKPIKNTIKVLQLNAWTGRVKGALLEYFKNNDFDIICLQESVWSKNREMLEHFSVSVDRIKEVSGLEYVSRAANWEINSFNSTIAEGISILSRFPIINETIEIIHNEYKIATTSQELRDHCYKAQLIKLENGLNIVNYHGYWLPDPIGDTTTIHAMKKVAEMAKKSTGPLIMCGDLNVEYNSPAMRELDFLTDLTNTYHIDNTLVGLKFNGKVACDHILINDQVKIQNFIVEEKIISDHKALIAEIELINTKEKK